MPDVWHLHVACNDRNGVMPACPPPEVEHVAVYVGGDCAMSIEAGYPLMFRECGEQELKARGIAARYGVKFYGVGVFPAAGIANCVGNIHWNAYAMAPTDVCRLLTWLRDLFGWRPTVGWAGPFDAMNKPSEDLSQPITPALFGPALEPA